MSDPRPIHQTTIAGDQQIARVEFVTADPGGYPWYPVHAWLHRSGLYPLIPAGARSVIDVLLWQLWEQAQQGGHTPGMVIASIEQIAAWSGDSTRTAFRSVGFLLEPPPEVVAITGQPARLLAKRGPTVWEPLPGRSLAGRKGGKPDTPLPTVAKTCHNSGVPLREARARQTNQPKAREIEPEERAQTTEPESCAGPLAGWPIGLAERRRAYRLAVEGDVHGLLIALGVWAHWAGPLSQSLHATPERILATAREVLADPDTASNPAYRLGFRLGDALGVPLPKSPSRQKLATAIEHHGLAGLVKLRAERARREADARRVSSAEFARTEDES